MPTNRSYIRRPHRSSLGPDQELDLWLGCGPRGNPVQFASDEARKAAWLLHRDRMTVPSAPGRRAQAWWRYDAPIPRHGIDRERSTLYAAGLLGEAEKAALEVAWRADFERGQDPDFEISMGPDEHLDGSAARRAHYRWADIPRELVHKWTAERKRAARTIRKLEAGSCQPWEDHR